MNPSNDLIRAIVDEDFVTAKELTSNMIFTAVSDVLDGAKREVAADLFSDCEECGSMDDAVNEGKDDPKPLVPNAPKKGSAASVAGGKGLRQPLKKFAAGKFSHQMTPSEYQRYFGKPKPVSEAKRAEKDYDGDGTIESPNAEVKGSHINAAVASGRLTPRQASRTKNKGKY